MKIVADCDIPFLKGVLEPYSDVVYLPGDTITSSDVADADALLTRSRTICDAALLSGSKVRFIGTATIGYDHIDTAFCYQNGITVATAKGCNARGVLQWVSAALAWLLSSPDCVPSGITLGVIGVGDIGSLVRQYASDWGFTVMCSDPPRETSENLTIRDGFYPLGEIAAKSDIITLHTPLTFTGPHPTYRMVNREFVGSTRDGAVIINSSRGAVIDPLAFNSAAARGRGFIIDTWNDEPEIDLSVLDKVLLGTPHIAGYTRQGKANATVMIVNALSAEFALPLSGWFPPDGERSCPRSVSWYEMCRTMPYYFDIAKESGLLKASPQDFEDLRNSYRLRSEFF